MPVAGRAEPPPTFDWTAIEQTPEFRELSAGRRRFAGVAGTLGIGAGLLYVVLCGLARGLMGTQLIGPISLAVLGGIALIVITWAITIAYMRRSAAVWQPLEEKIRARATEVSR